MTGPEHYEKAEKILKVLEKSHDMRVHQTMLAQAQVHATLALAAGSRERDE